MTIHTDEMEMMLTAILNGKSKDQYPRPMTEERSQLWDRLKADCDAMPKGAVVQIGSEGMPHDLTNLYKRR